MLARINDPKLIDDLVRFLRRHDYLAVQRGRDNVEVAPINSVSARADRKRVRRDLARWRSEHPDVTAEVVDGPDRS